MLIGWTGLTPPLVDPSTKNCTGKIDNLNGGGTGGRRGEIFGPGANI